MLDLALLNDAQRAAVLHALGPKLVLAGPGSGKTQVLTYMVAQLLHTQQARPQQLLVLTFTNKAARQMKERITTLIGPETQRLWMGTFHSLFARLLRREAEALGHTSHFSIYDVDDSKALFRTLIKELSLDPERYKLNMVRHRISGAKNRLLTAQQYAADAMLQQEDQRAGVPHMSSLFLRYQARCAQADAMDFDDLLLYAHRLFTTHPEVLDKYRQRFQYLLVDEFQDTNPLQYSLLKLLAATHRNLTVIGDDAQSIYAFRGADIRNILSFQKDFPQAAVFRLEQNYRSTKRIVQLADGLIRHNSDQLVKELFTDNPVGDPILVSQLPSGLEEAQAVARAIFDKSQQAQLPYDSFAILYRTNSQSQLLEEALRRNSIPYQVLGGVSFYQRKEVKDLLAYAALLVNSHNEQALQRVINLPKRGIGATTLAKVRTWAQEQGCTFWEALGQAKTFIKGRVADKIHDFVALIAVHKERLAHADAYAALLGIARASGLLEALYQDKTPEGLSRYEHIQELLNGVQTFTTHASPEEKTLAHFLEEVSLMTSTDTAEAADEPKVCLMTLHTAKGLEFPYVYIVGMEKDLFPSALMTHDRADMEEERRLFYVGITRAKKHLHLLYAQKRFKFGQLKPCEPSPFLSELDPSCLERSYVPKPAASRALPQAGAPGAPRSYTPLRKALPSTLQADDLRALKAGMQVRHPRFGLGRVVAIDRQGTYEKARIHFDAAGEKTLLLRFAKLQLVAGAS